MTRDVGPPEVNRWNRLGAHVTGVPEISSPEFSDDALALKFAAARLVRVRYEAASGRWMRWGSGRWKPDLTLRTRADVRAICRSAAMQCEGKIARDLASKKTVAAVEALARDDQRLAATPDQWDAEPWLLNTESGTVDLREGLPPRPHKALNYLTKMTAVAPAENNCFLWQAVLERSLPDPEVRKFLQRAVGYILTGVTREHALFFAHGGGANGKSVILNTIASVLGDYATTTPTETLMASNYDRHPTELAALRGFRLVLASETEKNRRWNQARLTQLTGGDVISARFMRGDFFEYRPTFKLFIAGNHKPRLRGIGEAVRRRFHLIHFPVTIPEHERDPQLMERLRPEWPNILGWAIRGCFLYQKHGLAAPEAVRIATRDYLEAEDSVAQWIEDCCDLTDAESFEATADLYSSWKLWAERAGEYFGSEKELIAGLEEDHGLKRHRQRRPDVRGVRGIRIGRATP